MNRITENRDYQRYSIGAGIQLQFKNGLGINSDLDVFMGNHRVWDYIRYTNYGTTDGKMYVEHSNRREYRTLGVQFGLSLTYMFQ